MDLDRYASLSREELVARLASLEQPASAPVAGPSRPKQDVGTPAKTGRRGKAKDNVFDFNVYPTRRVALLVAYHGEKYSGLAIQGSTQAGESINTVEAELLKALERSRLVEEEKGWVGCDFSRCGRTDAGVSAHGQVVSLRVRSNRTKGDGGVPLDTSWKAAQSPRPPKPEPIEEELAANDPKKPRKVNMGSQPKSLLEYSYPAILNRLLPPDINVIAWSPVEEDFNSRFSCTSRHYKYAFHVRPTPSTPELDIDLMRQAAQDLVGEHDFRNLCKVEGSRMIENHSRRVLKTWIEDGEYEGMKVFNLIGTAFLWHQIRHIIAILFLVGCKLEPTNLVKDLLDVERFPGKPAYNMGLPLPLTLWECGFPDGTIDWRFTGYDGPWSSLSSEEQRNLAGRTTHAALEAELEEQRQTAELRAWQVGLSLQKVRGLLGPVVPPEGKRPKIIPLGGGRIDPIWEYTPVIKRPLLESPEETNRRWWAKNRPGQPLPYPRTEELDVE